MEQFNILANAGFILESDFSLEKSATKLLQCAVNHGCVEAVDKFMELGLQINEFPRAIFYTRYETRDAKNTAMVRKLIGMGIDVNTKDNKQRTILQLAMRNGNVEITKELISLGAAVNSDCLATCSAWIVKEMDMSEYYEELLFQAMENNNPEMVKALAKKGVNLNMKRKKTPLPYGAQKYAIFEAAHYGNVEVIEALVECGVDINFKIKKGTTPLHYIARHNNHAEIFRV